MSEPLVSILIPTYNGERFLRPALRSALEQSHRNIEVLVGDDASSDRTPELLASVAAADPRVRVIRHERNLGAFDNPLHLLREARGEYVKFLLHDDVLATDCVRELVRGMQSSPDVSIAFSLRTQIDEDGRPVPGHEYPKLMDRPGLIDGRQLGDLVLESCSNVIGELTTILFRREDVPVDGLWQVDGRRLDVLNDLKLVLLLLARGSAWYTPRALSRFRRHATQNTFDTTFIARGVRDWPKLIDWGVRLGFLAGNLAGQRRAFARALTIASARVLHLADDPEYGPGLEGAFLATARLVELATGLPADGPGGLLGRAHRPEVLARFAQELDVWTQRFPAALAAPAAGADRLDATEVERAVEALRAVHAAGAAEKLLLAVPEHLAAVAVPTVEAALAAGPDIDVELVPTDDPAMLLRRPWLAVTTSDRAWDDGRATSVWRTPEPPDDGRRRAVGE